MEICEFKAWFEGFTEDMNGQPNAKQWKRIKARVKQVDGTPTTQRMFIDHYRRPYEPYWPQAIWYSTTNAPQQVSSVATTMAGDGVSTSLTANFTALGKAEAASVASP